MRERDLSSCGSIILEVDGRMQTNSKGDAANNKGFCIQRFECSKVTKHEAQSTKHEARTAHAHIMQNLLNSHQMTSNAKSFAFKCHTIQIFCISSEIFCIHLRMQNPLVLYHPRR